MMETWILVICTQAFGMCGHLKEVPYPSEESCYKAMNHLYKEKGADNFKYLYCKYEMEKHQ